MNNPLVSVVLCTYNDEKYIKQSIEAVLAQTYKNIEFIIWNDGSTDSTEQIVKSYNDSRIRYFYHENTGLGMALALACKKANGKYIARIDGDDICMPYRFEREVCYLDSHPNVVLVSSSVIYIDENGCKLGCSFPWTWNRNIKASFNIVHPAAMFRRDVYEKTCGYQDIKSAQDRILWSKMAKYGKFAIIQEPLIKYRWISTSLSHMIDVNSPYAKMLEVIRQKMSEDHIISPVDIEFHNKLYQLSKTGNNSGFTTYHQGIEEKVDKVLKMIIGDRLSRNVLIFFKNIYAYIKY